MLTDVAAGHRRTSIFAITPDPPSTQRSSLAGLSLTGDPQAAKPPQDADKSLDGSAQGDTHGDDDLGAVASHYVDEPIDASDAAAGEEEEPTPCTATATAAAHTAALDIVAATTAAAADAATPASPPGITVEAGEEPTAHSSSPDAAVHDETVEEPGSVGEGPLEKSAQTPPTPPLSAPPAVRSRSITPSSAGSKRDMPSAEQPATGDDATPSLSNDAPQDDKKPNAGSPPSGNASKTPSERSVTPKSRASTPRSTADRSATPPEEVRGPSPPRSATPPSERSKSPASTPRRSRVATPRSEAKSPSRSATPASPPRSATPPSSARSRRPVTPPSKHRSRAATPASEHRQTARSVTPRSATPPSPPRSVTPPSSKSSQRSATPASSRRSRRSSVTPPSSRASKRSVTPPSPRSVTPPSSRVSSRRRSVTPPSPQSSVSRASSPSPRRSVSSMGSSPIRAATPRTPDAQRQPQAEAAASAKPAAKLTRKAPSPRRPTMSVEEIAVFRGRTDSAVQSPKSTKATKETSPTKASKTSMATKATKNVSPPSPRSAAPKVVSPRHAAAQKAPAPKAKAAPVAQPFVPSAPPPAPIEASLPSGLTTAQLKRALARDNRRLEDEVMLLQWSVETGVASLANDPLSPTGRSSSIVASSSAATAAALGNAAQWRGGAASKVRFTNADGFAAAVADADTVGFMAQRRKQARPWHQSPPRAAGQPSPNAKRSGSILRSSIAAAQEIQSPVGLCKARVAALTAQVAEAQEEVDQCDAYTPMKLRNRLDTLASEIPEVAAENESLEKELAQQRHRMAELESAQATAVAEETALRDEAAHAWATHRTIQKRLKGLQEIADTAVADSELLIAKAQLVHWIAEESATPLPAVKRNANGRPRSDSYDGGSEEAPTPLRRKGAPSFVPAPPGGAQRSGRFGGKALSTSLLAQSRSDHSFSSPTKSGSKSAPFVAAGRATAAAFAKQRSLHGTGRALGKQAVVIKRFGAGAGVGTGASGGADMGAPLTDFAACLAVIEPVWAMKEERRLLDMKAVYGTRRAEAMTKATRLRRAAVQNTYRDGTCYVKLHPRSVLRPIGQGAAPPQPMSARPRKGAIEGPGPHHCILVRKAGDIAHVQRHCDAAAQLEAALRKEIAALQQEVSEMTHAAIGETLEEVSTPAKSVAATSESGLHRRPSGHSGSAPTSQCSTPLKSARSGAAARKASVVAVTALMEPASATAEAPPVDHRPPPIAVATAVSPKQSAPKAAPPKAAPRAVDRSPVRPLLKPRPKYTTKPVGPSQAARQSVVAARRRESDPASAPAARVPALFTAAKKAPVAASKAAPKPAAKAGPKARPAPKPAPKAAPSASPRKASSPRQGQPSQAKKSPSPKPSPKSSKAPSPKASARGRDTAKKSPGVMSPLKARAMARQQRIDEEEERQQQLRRLSRALSATSSGGSSRRESRMEVPEIEKARRAVDAVLGPADGSPPLPPAIAPARAKGTTDTTRVPVPPNPRPVALAASVLAAAPADGPRSPDTVSVVSSYHSKVRRDSAASVDSGAEADKESVSVEPALMDKDDRRDSSKVDVETNRPKKSPEEAKKEAPSKREVSKDKETEKTDKKEKRRKSEDRAKEKAKEPKQRRDDTGKPPKETKKEERKKDPKPSVEASSQGQKKDKKAKKEKPQEPEEPEEAKQPCAHCGKQLGVGEYLKHGHALLHPACSDGYIAGTVGVCAHCEKALVGDYVEFTSGPSSGSKLHRACIDPFKAARASPPRAATPHAEAPEGSSETTPAPVLDSSRRTSRSARSEDGASMSEEPLSDDGDAPTPAKVQREPEPPAADVDEPAAVRPRSPSPSDDGAPFSEEEVAPEKVQSPPRRRQSRAFAEEAVDGSAEAPSAGKPPRHGDHRRSDLTGVRRKSEETGLRVLSAGDEEDTVDLKTLGIHGKSSRGFVPALALKRGSAASNATPLSTGRSAGGRSASIVSASARVTRRVSHRAGGTPLSQRSTPRFISRTPSPASSRSRSPSLRSSPMSSPRTRSTSRASASPVSSRPSAVKVDAVGHATSSRRESVVSEVYSEEWDD